MVHLPPTLPNDFFGFVQQEWEWCLPLAAAVAAAGLASPSQVAFLAAGDSQEPAAASLEAAAQNASAFDEEVLVTPWSVDLPAGQVVVVGFVGLQAGLGMELGLVELILEACQAVED